MKFDELKEALDEAKQALTMADRYTGTMIEMIAGRLSKMPMTYYRSSLLNKLKRELQDWNMQTRKWKK